MSTVKKLFENLYLIDGLDLNIKERTGSYVLHEQELTIIETSASPSVPHIINGLKSLGLSPKDLKYIIVTHIHLDHAGGAGLLLQQCPDAKVIVHPKGKRHLADPSRLIAGAKAVYREKFDTLFHPIIPIPEEQLLSMDDGDKLQIGEDCTLTFYHTPGHANHHFSIYHPKLNGMFTGDTAGIYYQLKDEVEFYLPTTTPSNFDPDKMEHSIGLYKSMNLDYIFFGHYGMSDNPKEVYKQVLSWIKPFVDVAAAAFKNEDTTEEMINVTKAGLFQLVSSHLDALKISREHEIYDILALDLEVCAMGLIDYLHKKNR
ncbi:MBL fold metallo-hydrolase [Robertmurraya sp. DFI.2.37]|uniref:MBL fold metallo-hydrolase n=1 Tax=Robertmurraya sp. DFI.2.37 TaxID=3031819 RepID=UPI0012482D95|nr:MBL fold metallo-hydrolase [Robertmurraya sp. DFI.2.37]MDF1506767.1 MBL fold metallo-hydrolase [Robertmurraya sp. DFI.2.37]